MIRPSLEKARKGASGSDGFCRRSEWKSVGALASALAHGSQQRAGADPDGIARVQPEIASMKKAGDGWR